MTLDIKAMDMTLRHSIRLIHRTGRRRAMECGKDNCLVGRRQSSLYELIIARFTAEHPAVHAVRRHRRSTTNDRQADNEHRTLAAQTGRVISGAL